MQNAFWVKGLFPNPKLLFPHFSLYSGSYGTIFALNFVIVYTKWVKPLGFEVKIATHILAEILRESR